MPPPASATGQAAALSKAQLFEDEKRRIMQSCFHKQDTDGSLLESYITHCRIVEFSPPSAEPPPPGSNAEEKARLVFVAVRKSGRVRMHKARENGNGSFSIGKTWNLDDLQSITTYGPPNEKGFTVTIIKPYYWQANSSKEKDFFISSMIKIYKKYTGGKLPELLGFGQSELKALGASEAAAQQPPPQQQQQQQAPLPIEDPRRPRTPASHNGQAQRSASSSSASAQQPPTQRPPPQRTPSAAPSIDSMRSRGDSQRSYEAPPPQPRPPPSGPVPAVRPARSTDQMGNRRPSDGPPQGYAAPPVPSPPTLPSSLQGARPRQPSDSSTTVSRPGPLSPPVPPGPQVPSGQRRSNSRPRASDDERGGRRSPPSQERFRTPSINSQLSQDSRRERDVTEQQPPMPKSQSPLPKALSPFAPPPLQDQPMAKQRSNRDIANQFRAAANTYNVVGALKSPQNRPRTPTTPNSTAAKESTLHAPPEPVPAVPQPTYLEQRRQEQRELRERQEREQREREQQKEQAKIEQQQREQDQRERQLKEQQQREAMNGNGSAYGGRTSQDSRRRPSGEDGRPSSKSSRDRVPPLAAIPPLPKEAEVGLPPPRNETRGRPSISREISEPIKSVQPPADRPIPSVSEPSLPLEDPRTKPPSIAVSGTQDVDRRANRDSLGVPHPPGKSRSRSRSRKRSSFKTSPFLENLDTSQLTVDIGELLQEFGWDRQKKLDDLNSEVKKELSRVESSNVVINLDQDNRVDQLSEMLDKAIQECEEVDGLLTLYAVELTSLNDDIFHIESQSQGLQVATANQKTLQKELEDLLSTISISPQQIDVLRQGSLENARGLEQIEQTLLVLYKALRTIDSDSRTPYSPRPGGRRSSFSDEGIGSMKALQEKKDEYRQSCHAFLTRLQQFLNIKFQAEMPELGKALKLSDANSGIRPRLLPHDDAYHKFWKLSGLVAFAKDIDGDQYAELQKLYERSAKQLYQDEFRDHMLAWKKITRKPTPEEESELVFTTPEKEYEHSAVAAARKLTIKKSIAQIRTRSDSFSSKDKDRSPVGIIPGHETFAGAFGEIFQLLFKEQNFIVEFFHMSSQAPADFMEFVQNGTTTPETRRLGDLGGIRAVEPDKGKAKVIFTFMSDIFSFLPQELQSFAEYMTTTDPTQAVGIMYTIEQKLLNLEETNQEFLVKTFQALHVRLEGIFQKFIDEQIKAIEDTKVKIKKRKGVIGFMRVFPPFSAKIEAQIPYSPTSPTLSPTTSSSSPQIRDMVNKAYTTLNTAMFDSLRAIAKSMPTESVDPEDKEQLNYHITLLENMHHYLSHLNSHDNPILSSFLSKARDEYSEHLSLYVSAVIRRPVGKLLDLVAAVETNPDAVAKATFKKTLGNHDGKEIRKGIEALRKRVEKHFDGENSLVGAVEGRLEDEYVALHKRVLLLLQGANAPFKDSGLEVEFLVSDVRAGFKK